MRRQGRLYVLGTRYIVLLERDGCVQGWPWSCFVITGLVLGCTVFPWNTGYVYMYT